MRQYMIDELNKKELEEIRRYLDSHLECSGLEGLYWIRMPDDILSADQYQHQGCQPFCTAVELGDKWVKFEMLVRSRRQIKCSCISYATGQQRGFILKFADRMLDEIGITT